MLNLNSIMVSSGNAKALMSFYEKVFEKSPDMGDEEGAGWQIGGCFFGVGGHSQIQGKNKEASRIMFNLETKEIDAEFERIKAIDGAEVIKEPYKMEGAGDMQIATFSDPDGNYFQLMTPWNGQK